MAVAPVDETLTLADLTRDPYPIYKRMRAETPIVQVPAANRIFLTKAKHTKMVKDDPELYSSDDPVTPMRRAFLAHTLMRKDGEEHRRERMAMTSPAKKAKPETLPVSPALFSPGTPGALGL